VSKLKILFPVIILVGFIVGLFPMVGCNKTNTTVVKDSVYYSPWMSIAMSPTDAGDTIYEGSISAANVTASIVSGGAVVTYLGEPGYPSTGDTAAETALDFGLYTTLTPGSIQLTSYGLDNDFSTLVSGLVFRYVVIPGTVLATTSLRNYTQQQLSKMSFTDLQKAANTPVLSTSGAKPVTP
jgi:hypothetical protein